MILFSPISTERRVPSNQTPPSPCTHSHRTMAQVLSLTTRDMNDVGASVHRHMSLDTPFRRRGSFDLTPDGRPSTNSFRAGSGRKRASTIQNADANHGMFVPLTTGTSGQVAQDGSRDIICLCTPAPKIPRPRNGKLLNPSLPPRNCSKLRPRASP